ncbi:hypothetical protein SRIMM317S_06007 [Streptomyces rimosus subsp. rimosus]
MLNSSCAACGMPLMRYGALSAWTVITDMWWATTSCSSRAIRVRSSSSVRMARSASLMFSCSISLRCAAPRSRSAAPTSSTTPERVNISTQVPSPWFGRTISKKTLTAPVAPQTAISVRRRSRSESASIRTR